MDINVLEYGKYLSKEARKKLAAALHGEILLELNAERRSGERGKKGRLPVYSKMAELLNTTVSNAWTLVNGEPTQGKEPYATSDVRAEFLVKHLYAYNPKRTITIIKADLEETQEKIGGLLEEFEKTI